MAKFIKARPAFYIFGVDSTDDGNGCVLMVSPKVLDYQHEETREFGGPWISELHATFVDWKYFRGENFGECFRKMAEYYQEHGGFSEPEGLPSPTRELE